MKKRIFKINLLLNFLILITTHVVFCQENNKNTSFHGTNQEVHDISEDRILSELSAKESEWYSRFKEGVLFFDGWNEISEDILDTFPPNMVEGKKILVKRIGIKIGSEWCRKNKERKIDSDMLKQWGRQLRVAVAKGPEDTDEALREIETEVDRLLEISNRLTLFTPPS